METSKEFFYRVCSGDTINLLCRKFNTDKDNILRNNPNIDLYVGEMVKIKVLDYTTYIVKPTQTIEDISKEMNIEVEDIEKFNKLQSRKLYIGQVLKLPKKKG